MSAAPPEIWEQITSLRPIIEQCRTDTDEAGRLADAIVNAFAERNIYRFLLPTDLGGKGLDPQSVEIDCR